MVWGENDNGNAGNDVNKANIRVMPIHPPPEFAFGLVGGLASDANRTRTAMPDAYGVGKTRFPTSRKTLVTGTCRHVG